MTHAEMNVESPLRILSIEDDALDAELIQETLADAGIDCELTRVDSEATLIDALERGGVDLILADYTLPSFDGLSALKITRQNWPDLPFIFVSGTLGEEVAIEALKIGATDYVLKTRLSRLVPSVHRALRESKERVERKRAEDALRRSEAYLAAAQRLSLTGSFGWNVSSGDIYWSEETFRIMEYDPATRITIDMILDRTHPEDRSTVQQVVDCASQNRTDFDFEHRLLLPGGAVKHLRVVGHPVASESGKCEFVGAVTDITERKRAEELLRQSEHHFRRLVDATPAMIHAAQPNGQMEFLNQTWLNYLGRPLEELTGWGWADIFHPDDLERIVAQWRAAMASGVGTACEGRVRRADGEYRAMLHRKVPLRGPDGGIEKWYGSSTDIEDLRRAEAGMKESEERFRTMADTLPDVLWITALNPEAVLYVSPSFRDIWGLPLDDLYGNPRVWTESIHPEDRDHVVCRFTKWIAGENVGYDNLEYRIIRPDGST
jgi:PAS domain S-box-containing protein